MNKSERRSLEKLQDRLSKHQSTAYVISRKLESWGILLERQGRECQGFPELEGLGIELSAFGRRLDRIAHSLDMQGVRLAKVLKS